MQIVVSNGNQRKRLNLPCSDAELNAAVRDIGIKDIVPYANIYSIAEPQSGLEHLIGQNVNLDELNFYVKRWESLVNNQKKKLCACAESGEYNTLKDMINLTFHENGFYLIDDFSNMKTTGMRIFMDKYGGIAEDEQEHWDFEKLAKETISDCKSKITQYGLLLDGGGVREQTYNGRTFPHYLYAPDKTVVSLEIQNASGERDYLYLPTDIVSMEKLKSRLGAERFCECKMTDFCNIRLPDRVSDIVKRAETIEELALVNEMCGKVVRFNEEKMERFQMAADFVKASKPEELTALADHLDRFEVVKGVFDMKSYGNYIINESGLFEVDDLIRPFIDYKRFGQDRVESIVRIGGFTEDGFVGTDADLPAILSYAGEDAEPLEIPEEEYPVLRLYNLLRGSLYEENTYGDTVIDSTDLSAGELVKYQDVILEQIQKESRPGEEARGLMHYYHRDRAVKGKVIDAWPTVEEYQGELYGVLECRIREPLTKEELDKLISYWTGQESDGWGEGFEQRDIGVRGGQLNVRFWNCVQSPIQTEEELKGVAQNHTEGLLMQY